MGMRKPQTRWSGVELVKYPDMESIIIALITVITPLTIPWFASQFSVARADKRDKDIQEIAASLSMDSAVELISERRKRRIYINVRFRHNRLLGVSALILSMSFYFLFVFFARDRIVGDFHGLPESAIFIILILLVILYGVIGYIVLVGPQLISRKALKRESFLKHQLAMMQESEP